MRAIVAEVLANHRRLVEEEKERVASGYPGKLSARGRLDTLFDSGSFCEIGALVTNQTGSPVIPGDGVVTGYGTVGGRLVYAYAQDFTVVGGSLGAAQARKITRIQDLSLHAGAPIVALLESGGARIQEGIDALNGYGDIFRRNSQASGRIPQIAVVFGSCAGGAVYSPALMDFIFVIRDRSFLFVTGPKVVQVVTGEKVTAEELGGGMVHASQSGVAHFLCENEWDAISKVRGLMGYLSHGGTETGESALRKENNALDEVISEDPGKSYDVKDVIRGIVDKGTFLEYQAEYAQNCVTAFARMADKPVAIVANQPKILAGCIDINASDKMARFIRTAGNFGLPIVTLVDTPGYLPGTAQEHGGIIRHGAKLLYAYSMNRTLMVTVILRKAFGGAYIAMGSKSLGAEMVFAWPFAQIAVMGAQSAASIIYRKEIAASDDPATALAEKTKAYESEVMNPRCAASRGYIDDIIRPAETRGRIVGALIAGEPQETLPNQGNIPL